ncbi:MAG: ABC transporter ATP-binding protein [Nitrososphaerota archaeon]
MELVTRVEAVELVKRYGSFVAVDKVTLRAREGELVTILGPSGCGKSTTLRMLAGLIPPDWGRIFFDERDVTSLPPDKRNIGFVFQRVALFPHMNVYKNVAFGLEMRKLPKRVIQEKVKEALRLVHMEGYEDRMPSQLSGGQAQRVEIARVLATDPEVLLFDEPLSNIDAKLKDELKYEIRRIQRETRKTMIYVTHDQAEAFAISDRVYVMNNGRIEQEGSPLEIYTNPRTPFIAAFIGTTNFIETSIKEYDEKGGIATLEAAGLEIRVRHPSILDKRKRYFISIRPEDIKVINPNDQKSYLNALKGTVEDTIFIGTTVRLNININGLVLKVDTYGAERFSFLDSKGKEIVIGFDSPTILNM